MQAGKYCGLTSSTIRKQAKLEKEIGAISPVAKGISGTLSISAFQEINCGGQGEDGVG